MGNLLLRPDFWQQRRDLTFIGIWTCLLIGLAFVEPADQIFALVFLIVVPICAEAYTVMRVRITVTPDDIRIVDVPFVKRSAPRRDVTVLRIFPVTLAMRNENGQTVLRTRMYWTRNQLLELAEKLGVPLWDHRRWHGWGQVKVGKRVVRDPVSGKPVATN